MTCPQPKRCACGEALPPSRTRPRAHCDACVLRLRTERGLQRAQRGKKPAKGCPHCAHCQAQAVLAQVQERVAAALEAQEWRAAAAAVRDMDLQSPGGDA